MTRQLTNQQVAGLLDALRRLIAGEIDSEEYGRETRAITCEAVEPANVGPGVWDK